MLDTTHAAVKRRHLYRRCKDRPISYVLRASLAFVTDDKKHDTLRRQPTQRAGTSPRPMWKVAPGVDVRAVLDAGLLVIGAALKEHRCVTAWATGEW